MILLGIEKYLLDIVIQSDKLDALSLAAVSVAALSLRNTRRPGSGRWNCHRTVETHHEEELHDMW